MSRIASIFLAGLCVPFLGYSRPQPFSDQA